jgi:hypothetical protein
MQRDYVEFLAGKLILQEKFSGAFKVRRDKMAEAMALR